MFGNITIKGRVSKISSFVYRFLETLTYHKIVSTGEKFQIYRKYNIFDTIELTQKLIAVGEIETPGTGVVIFLEEKHEGKECRLLVFRDSGGKLRIRVDYVYLESEEPASRGVLFN